MSLGGGTSLGVGTDRSENLAAKLKQLRRDVLVAGVLRFRDLTIEDHAHTGARDQVRRDDRGRHRSPWDAR